MEAETKQLSFLSEGWCGERKMQRLGGFQVFCTLLLGVQLFSLASTTDPQHIASLEAEPPSGSCSCSLSSSQFASVLQQIGQQLDSDPPASPLGRTVSHIISLIPTTNPLFRDTRFCFLDGALTIPLIHLPMSRNSV